MPADQDPLSPKENEKPLGQFDFALPLETPRRVKHRALTTQEKVKTVRSRSTKTLTEKPTPPAPKPDKADDEPGLIPIPIKPDREIEQEAPPLPVEPQKVDFSTRASLPTPPSSINKAPRLASTVNPTNPTKSTLYYANRKESYEPSASATPTSEPKNTPNPSTAPNPTSSSEPAAPHNVRPTPLMKTTPPGSITTSLGRPNPEPRADTGAQPKGIPDYRANMQRQAREQKSFGNILSIVVYALATFFVISVGLASYGGYILYAQIQGQSVTISGLDSKVTQQNAVLLQKITEDNNLLIARLSDTEKSLTDARLTITQQQQTLLQQQQDLTKALKAIQDEQGALNHERYVRQAEATEFKSRLRRLENATH